MSVSPLACLPVVLPLLMAAVLAGIGSFAPRRVFDVLSILTAAVTCIICCLLVRQTLDQPLVYWFGSWKPDAQHFPVGISFVIDPLGAGLAALTSALMTAALIFTWSYQECVKSLFHAIMLVFMAAMCGLSLTGDLFNMFVWFELMTAAAVALCGFKSTEAGPLVGALNFAVVNTIGAFLTLTGIGLLYGQTGALNLAAIADALQHHPPAPSVMAVIFLFIASGFLTKAAAFPFHFWLADAHAVAPTPVSVLFSGVMVELGIYAIARIYFASFADAFKPHESAVHSLLLTIGVSTAVVGAIECFGQRHIKRLLAFSTISHAGLMIIALSLLEHDALAGGAIYLVGHGLTKGALFICAGILLHRFGSVDETELHGRGKDLHWLAVLMAVGALGLAAMPPFGTFYGEAMVEEAAEKAHLSWLSWVYFGCAVLTAGAVLRVVGRVFFGWGDRGDKTDTKTPKEGRETEGTAERVPICMWGPAVVLLALAIGCAIAPSVRAAVKEHADAFTQTAAQTAYVLAGTPLEHTPASAETFPSFWRELLAVAGAFLVAGLALAPGYPGSQAVTRITKALWKPFSTIQSGRVTDYVAWFLAGMALWGGLFLLGVR